MLYIVSAQKVDNPNVKFPQAIVASIRFLLLCDILYPQKQQETKRLADKLLSLFLFFSRPHHYTCVYPLPLLHLFLIIKNELRKLNAEGAIMTNLVLLLCTWFIFKSSWCSTLNIHAGQRKQHLANWNWWVPHSYSSYLSEVQMWIRCGLWESRVTSRFFIDFAFLNWIARIELPFSVIEENTTEMHLEERTAVLRCLIEFHRDKFWVGSR